MALAVGASTSGAIGNWWNSGRRIVTQEKEMHTGTVTYVGLEGGFYGIVDDTGRHLDPVNLPPQFHKNGLKIRFSYMEAKNKVSFHMWGILVELLEIEQVNE